MKIVFTKNNTEFEVSRVYEKFLRNNTGGMWEFNVELKNNSDIHSVVEKAIDNKTDDINIIDDNNNIKQTLSNYIFKLASIEHIDDTDDGYSSKCNVIFSPSIA